MGLDNILYKNKASNKPAVGEIIDFGAIGHLSAVVGFIILLVTFLGFFRPFNA